MEPVTLIVSAIALGATAGLQESAATAVKEAYEALKRLIRDRYQDVDVAPVERRPESEAKRGSLEEDLDAAGAGADDELLAAARRLVQEVRNHEPAAGAAVGIDLEGVEAAALRIGGVTSSGTGVRVRQGKFAGDIEINDVRAGQEPPGRP
ncbi:hypothetical protein [Streptosporangium sp. NPDC048865]|uniref:hypothetical protein n=1 Tax=Streptosporangium sp. NPDC048865 TaxID=3155766 RepID=UPI0034376774